MKTAINIVVTCTNRKSIAAPRGLRLRDVKAQLLEKRAERWITNLQASSVPPRPAVELYAGDHWAIARSLTRCAEAAGLSARLWVTSAGYGLVPSDALLRPYAATFSGRGPDAVVPNGAQGHDRDKKLASWWEALAAWAGPADGEPRSLAGLVARDAEASLLVVASMNYLIAMKHDLEAALGAIANANGLLIITTAGSACGGALKPNIVFTEARLRMSLGGSLNSLGVRIAAAILAGLPRDNLSPTAAREWLAALKLRRPELPVLKRSPMKDDQVRRFIRQHLDRDSGLTHTRLLRLIRAGGQACEQRRFRNLFLAVRRKM